MENWTMFKPFDLEMSWQLNGHEITDGNIGRFNYDPEKGSVLELTKQGSFFQVAESILESYSQDDIYYGKLNQWNVTLKKLISLGSSTISNELYRHRVQSQEVAIDNVSNNEEFKPNILEFSLTNLKYWLPLSNGITYEKDRLIFDESKIKPFIVGGFKVDDTQNGRMNIATVWSRKIADRSRKVSLEFEPIIRIKFENTVSDDEAIDLVTQLNSLYELLLGIPTSIKFIRTKDSNTGKYRMFFVDARAPRVYEEDSRTILDKIEFNKVEQDLPKMVSNLLTLDRKNKLMLQNYKLTLEFTTVIENDLVNLTQAIEYIFKKESLKKKITAFLSGLPEALKKIVLRVVGDRDKWVTSIVDTRVFLVHGEDSRKHVITNVDELIFTTKLLQMLVRCYLLNKLGLTEGNINFEREIQELLRRYKPELKDEMFVGIMAKSGYDSRGKKFDAVLDKQIVDLDDSNEAVTELVANIGSTFKVLDKDDHFLWSGKVKTDKEEIRFAKKGQYKIEVTSDTEGATKTLGLVVR